MTCVTNPSESTLTIGDYTLQPITANASTEV